ncbi:hypothetical protein V6N13_009235 [Hibiscus sabdariffa]
MEKEAFLACSNAWLGESVNGNFLAILEGQGSRGKKARQKGVPKPGTMKDSTKGCALSSKGAKMGEELGASLRAWE